MHPGRTNSTRQSYRAVAVRRGVRVASRRAGGPLSARPHPLESFQVRDPRARVGGERWLHRRGRRTAPSTSPPSCRRRARPPEENHRVSETASPGTGQPRVRVASVPAADPYVDAVLPDDVERIRPAGPAALWLDADHLAAHAGEIDVLHLHI